MSRIRHVGGIYTKKVGGDYNMYSLKNINFVAAKSVNQNGIEEGESYTNQPEKPLSTNPYFEEGWWSLDKEGEKRISRAVPGMHVYFHIKTKNIPDKAIVYMELYDDDINEPEEKNEDDHIQLNRVETGKRVFYEEVQEGKIVKSILLTNFDSYIQDETDKCIELYFRCSYQNRHIQLPQKSEDYLAVGDLVIDRYKMPGLNEEGTDIASDMAYGFGGQPLGQIYASSDINKYKREYQKNGFDEQEHSLFSNAADNYEMEEVVLSNTNPVFDGASAVKKAGEAQKAKTLYSRQECYSTKYVINIPVIKKIIPYISTGLDIRIFDNFSDDMLFWDFKETAKMYFAQGDLEGNIDRMIEKMRSNEGGIYEDPVLTRAAAANQDTQAYCEKVEMYLAEKIKDNLLTLSDVEDTSPYFGTGADKNRRASKGKNFSRPAYSYNRLENLLGGLTIATNDIWSSQVILKELVFDGDNYTGKYQVTLWDHFGLDKPDMEKVFNVLPSAAEVFICWFILQHLRGYKPFITKIAFDREFTGNLQESKEGRKSRIENEKKMKWVENASEELSKRPNV